MAGINRTHLVGLRVEQLVAQTAEHGGAAQAPGSGTDHAVDRRARHTVVKLGHQEVQIGPAIVQNLKVRARVGREVGIHWRVGHLVPPAIVPVRVLEVVELRPEHGGHIVQEGLRLEVRIGGGALRATAGLLAGDVVTVLVVDVDPVEVLAVDDVHEGGGEFVLLAEAVIPAVVLIACILSNRVIICLQDEDE